VLGGDRKGGWLELVRVHGERGRDLSSVWEFVVRWDWESKLYVTRSVSNDLSSVLVCSASPSLRFPFERSLQNPNRKLEGVAQIKRTFSG